MLADLAPSAWWWGFAAVLLVAEMLTGSLYLLMLALGCAAAGSVSFVGAGIEWAMATAAVVSLLAVTWLRGWVRRRTRGAPTSSAAWNALDIGEPVEVERWHADQTARVRYRGSYWTAVPASDDAAPRPGRHVVVGIRNNQLVLRPAPIEPAPLR